MHMSIQHVCLRFPLRIPTVLSVVAHDRIMAENHLAIVIIDFSIMRNPFKTRWIKLFVRNKMIMISDDQILLSIQPFENGICNFSLF